MDLILHDGNSLRVPLIVPPHAMPAKLNRKYYSIKDFVILSTQGTWTVPEVTV